MPAAVSDLARDSGLSLNAADPGVHDLAQRGYVREERRRLDVAFGVAR
jgi:hypothetical protein